MRIPGYCTECHKIKQVRVSSAQLSRQAAQGHKVFMGICASCEEKQ